MLLLISTESLPVPRTTLLVLVVEAAFMLDALDMSVVLPYVAFKYV